MPQSERKNTKAINVSAAKRISANHGFLKREAGPRHPGNRLRQAKSRRGLAGTEFAHRPCEAVRTKGPIGRNASAESSNAFAMTLKVP